MESTDFGNINCNMSADLVDNNTKHLIELCELYQFKQLIQEPTIELLAIRLL